MHKRLTGLSWTHDGVPLKLASIEPCSVSLGTSANKSVDLFACVAANPHR